MPESRSERLLSTRAAERDFLLSSLEDLDAEAAAGDLDESDYRVLKAGYTARAAGVIRAIDRVEAASTPPPKSWGRTAMWVAGIIVVSGLAGLWLAEFSGSRRAGDTITGDIRESVRSRLFDAQAAGGEGDYDLAIEIYDDVLEDEPSNTEALAYRGWITRLAGDAATARTFVRDAVEIDPAYADARVFAVAIALELGDSLGAAEHLAVLDTIDSAPFIQQLVSVQGLRDRVGVAASASARILVEPVLLGEFATPFAASGLSLAEVALAAEGAGADGEIEVGLRLFESMLADSGDDPDVLAAFGWYIGRASVGLDVGLETAEAYLTDALALEESRPDALVYRAFVRVERDDLAGAAEDLAAYDALTGVRHDLDLIITEGGLRETLS